MQNIMSVELVEWANLASNVKSPVSANLALILQQLSKMSDKELLTFNLLDNNLLNEDHY